MEQREKQRRQTTEVEEAKKYIKHLLLHSKSKLDTITVCMRSIILEDLCKRNNVEYILDNETHADYLCNLAIIEYAYRWLFKDISACQNLHAFCREKFLPQGYESRLTQKEPYGANYNSLYKTQRRCICEEKIILNQAIAEKRIIPHKSNGSDSRSESGKEKNADISNHNNHHADRFALGTNSDEREQTNSRLSYKI